MFYITIPLTSTKVLFIPKGSTSNIISYLDKSGFELNIVDKVVLRSLGFIQSGWINIDKNYLTKMDFLYKNSKYLRRERQLQKTKQILFMHKTKNFLPIKKAKCQILY